MQNPNTNTNTPPQLNFPAVIKEVIMISLAIMTSL